MNRNRPLPGSRIALYGASLAGALKTAQRSLDEAGASSETIDPTTRAERRDVNAKGVLLAGIGVLVAIWAIVLLIYPLFTHFKYARTGGRDPSKVLSYIPPSPPIPRNEDHPYRVLKEYNDRVEGLLHNYNWMDRSRGIIAIPIERAMQLLVERGIPPSRSGGAEYETPEAGSKQTGHEGKVMPKPR